MDGRSLWRGIKSIVEVETDEGIVGLGEAPWWHFGEVIKAEIAPALIGADPLDLADCEGRCVPPWQITANTGENAAAVAFGSVELALWDIRGKAFGMPLYKLLGGAVRKDIPFSEYFAFRARHGDAGGEMTPEAIVDYCLRMRDEHGSTIFEGKLIMGDPELEIRTVRMLREALGEKAQIKLDSNMQWSLTTARRVLARSSHSTSATMKIRSRRLRRWRRCASTQQSRSPRTYLTCAVPWRWARRITSCATSPRWAASPNAEVHRRL